MNFKKKLLIFILFFPIIVNAKYDVFNPECTNNVKMNLRNQIPKISFVPQKYFENDKISYKIEIIGLSNVIDIIDLDTNMTYEPKEVVEIKKISPGTIKRLTLIVNSNNVCEGYKIYTKNISIPHYNKFSKHELCKNNEDFILCSETYPTSITEDYFLRSIKEYNSKNDEKEKEPQIINKENNNDNFLKTIFKFFENYYMHILIPIIISSITGIIIIQVKKRRNIL